MSSRCQPHRGVPSKVPLHSLSAILNSEWRTTIHVGMGHGCATRRTRSPILKRRGRSRFWGGEAVPKWVVAGRGAGTDHGENDERQKMDSRGGAADYDEPPHGQGGVTKLGKRPRRSPSPVRKALQPLDRYGGQHPACLDRCQGHPVHRADTRQSPRGLDRASRPLAPAVGRDEKAQRSRPMGREVRRIRA